MTPNHYSNYPAFYRHPLIQRLADNPRWSVSGLSEKDEEEGRTEKSKTPLSLLPLENGRRFGATNHSYWKTSDDNKGAAGTLQDVCDIVPDWPNVAYWIDTQIDNLIVVDIEPTCPQEIKDIFLQSDFLYGELSMSGKGYHLFYPMDYQELLLAYPIAATKTNIKDESGFYEIHLSHWITFTRRSFKPLDQPNHAPAQELIEKLLAAAKPSVKADYASWNPDIDVDSIKYYDIIMRNLENNLRYKKTSKDFADDNSRALFSFIGTVHTSLRRLLISSPDYIKAGYTSEQILYMLHEYVSTHLPWRTKYDTFRNGVPYLVAECQDNMAKWEADMAARAEEKKKKRKAPSVPKTAAQPAPDENQKDNK